MRSLLAGRVPVAEVEGRAAELLVAAARKRLEAGETVVIATEGFDAEERERYVTMAATLRRPRHLILLEGGRASVAEEDRADLNALRKRLDAGKLGEDGFQTAMRLGGDSVRELRRSPSSRCAATVDGAFAPDGGVDCLYGRLALQAHSSRRPSSPRESRLASSWPLEIHEQRR